MIKDVAPLLKECEETLKELKRMGNMEVACYVQGFINSINKLPDVNQRPQWIPCSKRLPEEIGDYIVTEDLSDGVLAVYVSSFGHVRTGKLCFYYEDEDDRAITIDDIVAWMPLPEPYEKER